MAEDVTFPDLVKLHDAIKVSEKAAEKQVGNVLMSLKAISNKLKDWGKSTGVIGSSVPPNPKTVQEVSEALDELLELLMNLEKWLEKCIKKWLKENNPSLPVFEELLNGIPEARKLYLTDNIRTLLYTYLQWRLDIKDKKIVASREDTISYENDRKAVASNIFKLGDSLIDTVEKASEKLEF